jgi:predicted DNA-binding transcriptional regulator YafY
MANTATRLITLIMLLQRQPHQNAAQLAQTLDVSVRTLQRYIARLDEMGIPIYAECGLQGGYALVRGYKMPPLIFTPEEAVALYLGTSLLEEVWGRLYQEAVRGTTPRQCPRPKWRRYWKKQFCSSSGGAFASGTEGCDATEK